MGGGGKSKKGGGGGGGAQQQPKPGGGGKAARKAADAEFDSILKEAKQTIASTMQLDGPQRLSVRVSALGMAGLPQIFFHSPVFYDVDVPAYKAQFIGVVLLSALALLYAYISVASARQVKLLGGREAEAKGSGGGGSREERAAAETAMAQATTLEALSYALWVVNALYLLGFLTLAFKACEAAAMQPAHTQLLSTLLPAVLLASQYKRLA